jgi:transposase
MLKEGTGFSRVIICCGRVDLRKGIPGLSAYVRLNYGLDAAEKGTLFLFCGNRTNCIKGLLFEGDGMLLLTKKLFAGNRFQWPRTPDEARELTPEQFRRLMDGFAIEGSIKEIYTKQQDAGDGKVREQDSPSPGRPHHPQAAK